MATVVVSAFNVANFPEGGGHFWAYMQYVQGLRQLGCDVYWLENFRSTGDPSRDAAVLSAFFKRTARYGLDGRVILYTRPEHASSDSAGTTQHEYIGIASSEAQAIFRRADLLLNFHYGIDP